MATAALERHYGWLKAKFFIVTAAAAGNMIIFVIDPIKVLHTRDICADPAGVRFDRSGAKMRIGAIYCSDSTVSEVWASLDRPGSAADDLLAEVIYGLTWRVIPWTTKDQQQTWRTGSGS